MHAQEFWRFQRCMGSIGLFGSWDWFEEAGSTGVLKSFIVIGGFVCFLAYELDGYEFTI